MQANESVSSFAQAYCLGEKESAAAINLLQNIPAAIKESLTELVRNLELISELVRNLELISVYS